MASLLEVGTLLHTLTVNISVRIGFDYAVTFKIVDIFD